jgi:hypothetical protein
MGSWDATIRILTDGGAQFGVSLSSQL